MLITMSLLAVFSGCRKADNVDLEVPNLNLDSGGDTMFLTVKAEGSWTLSLHFPAGVDEWAKVNPSSGSGSAKLRFYYDGNPSDSDRNVTLTLTPAKGSSAKVTITQSSGAYPGWLEMPAFKSSENCELLIHDMTGKLYKSRSKSGVRNWSACFDKETRESRWVAYPLNNSLIGSGSRSDAWAYDALISSDYQQALLKSFPSTHRYYSNQVYDRGHQIPSADRLSYSANVTTFYMTNMTPQENGFNSGVWQKLETAVRSYAGKCDTLYVVTGCVTSSASPSVTDYEGHKIPVPTHYYKALLAKPVAWNSGQGGKKGYVAAAFYLPHISSISASAYRSYRCSIDELEAKTGIDFFPNLERVIGKEDAAEVEAQTPSSWWN